MISGMCNCIIQSNDSIIGTVAVQSLVILDKLDSFLVSQKIDEKDV